MVEELAFGVDSVVVLASLAHVVDVYHSKLRLCGQLCRRSLDLDLSVLHTFGVEQEALGSGSSENKHLAGAEGECSNGVRPDELGVFDLEFVPTMLCHRVAVIHFVHISWELASWSRVEVTNKQRGASLALRVVARHQIHILVVHHDGSGAHTGDW